MIVLLLVTRCLQRVTIEEATPQRYDTFLVEDYLAFDGLFI